MPWWGYALCALFIWLVGLMTGRALGRAEVLQQVLAQRAMPDPMQALMRGVTPRGENASERQP
jgi:hypothetical protein